MTVFNELMLNDMGISLLLLESEGTIAFQPNYAFVPVYDYHKDGICACFDEDGFGLIVPQADGTVLFDCYKYSTAYPANPVLKTYLKQLNLTDLWRVQYPNLEVKEQN